MSVRQAYSTWASTYDSDRNLTRDLDQSVTRQVLSPYPCAAALELGCGTGKNTAFLATLARQVVALDFSEGMMQQAKAKIQRDNVLFAFADLTLPLPCKSQQFDLVVCNLVLEHLHDLTPVFAEVYRVLVAGGHFFISELHPFKQYQGKKAVFEHDRQQVEISAFVHHISSFVDAAESAGFKLKTLREWWHDDDQSLNPRLITFLFEK